MIIYEMHELDVQQSAAERLRQKYNLVEVDLPVDVNRAEGNAKVCDLSLLAFEFCAYILLQRRARPMSLQISESTVSWSSYRLQMNNSL